VQPLINELMSAGYSVKLVHDATETSWENTEEHGFIVLKSADGTELIRKGGFQHNRKLRNGGSWDATAVQEVCAAAKKAVKVASAA